MPRLKTIELIRKGGGVARYHTEHINGVDSVASHSWGVAILISVLNPSPSADLIQAALMHDVAEGVVGDVPWPAKKRWPMLNEQLKAAEKEVLIGLGVSRYENNLRPSDMNWLKICDMLDLVLFCREQINTGNESIREVYNRGIQALWKMKDLPISVKDILYEIGS